MFGLFKKRSPEAAKQLSAVPAGTRVYAIGDIHGCLDALATLADSIRRDCEGWDGETRLVFVGDYIDRGPDSAGVIDWLIRKPLGGRYHFLMGNHEEAMLEVIDGDAESLQGWLRFGGAQTLESYGIDRGEVYRLGIELPQRIREVVPQSHIHFLRALEDQVRIGDYLFVHAGIRPGTPLHEQEQFDLRWIREGFLDDDDSDHGVMVVHGHTITKEPDVRPNRIGIDTGCYSSGRLTALVLEGSDRRFLTS